MARSKRKAGKGSVGSDGGGARARWAAWEVATGYRARKGGRLSRKHRKPAGKTPPAKAPAAKTKSYGSKGPSQAEQDRNARLMGKAPSRSKRAASRRKRLR